MQQIPTPRAGTSSKQIATKVETIGARGAHERFLAYPKNRPHPGLLAFGTPGFAPDERLSSTQLTVQELPAMSLIKKSDVKNHLSARRRSRMHPQQQSPIGASSLTHEESAGTDPKLVRPLDIESSSPRQSVLIVMPKSIQD